LSNAGTARPASRPSRRRAARVFTWAGDQPKLHHGFLRRSGGPSDGTARQSTQRPAGTLRLILTGVVAQVGHAPPLAYPPPLRGKDRPQQDQIGRSKHVLVGRQGRYKDALRREPGL